MVFKTDLKDLSVEVLIALYAKSNGEYSREDIKNTIINEKQFANNYPLFYFVERFKKANEIFKELYADLILVKLQDEIFYIDDKTMNEIIKLASYDALIYYGANSKSLEISNKCQEEFYSCGEEIIDKDELEEDKKVHTRKPYLRIIK